MRKTIVYNIKKYRKEEHLTQEELAEKTEISYDFMRRMTYFTVALALDTKNNSVAKLDKLVPQSGNKAVVVYIDGVISSERKDSFWTEGNSSAAALEALVKAKSDDSVKGVILKINSPGGTVGMSQMLYNAVIELRKGKPVVALMGDIAAEKAIDFLRENRVEK